MAGRFYGRNLPLAALPAPHSRHGSDNRSVRFKATLPFAAMIWLAVAGTAIASRSDLPSSAQSSARPSWSDEFSGRAGQRPDPDKWKFDLGASGWGNRELQRYTSSRSNSRIDGRGHLRIIARHREGSGIRRGSYTSARLTTAGRFGFKYGRVAIRAKLPKGRGLWPAFWMLGEEFPGVDWPFCGEIDVMENLGQKIRISSAFVHGPGSMADTGIGGFHRSRTSLAKGFHVFAADWSAELITFSVDGEVFRRVPKATYPSGQTWAFDRRMFLLLNLAVGGSWPGKPSAATRFPARFVIDWVRVWKAAGSG